MKRLLIVEQSPVLLARLNTLLKREEYQKKFLMNGDNAHQATKDFQPDLVIMNAGLVDSDNQNAYHALREAKDGKLTIILYYSDLSDITPDDIFAVDLAIPIPLLKAYLCDQVGKLTE